MIHVIDKWYINASDNCYCVGECIRDKKNNLIMQQPRYVGKISTAIKLICEIEQRRTVSTQDMDLAEAVKRIEEVVNLFNDLLEKLEQE